MKINAQYNKNERLEPDKVLEPRGAWADKAAYDQSAAKLAVMFAAEVKKYG